jgi:hypothetical protein
MRAAPEKFINFIKFITLATFANIEPFMQMLGPDIRKPCHAEKQSISAMGAIVPESRDASPAAQSGDVASVSC